MDITALLNNSLNQNALLWIVVMAFIGGVVSSLLPCSVSFLPLTIAYMGGSSVGHHPALKSLVFVAGLCLSLTLLGLLASLIGVSLGTAVSGIGTILLGVVALLLGLQMLGWIHIPMPAGLNRLPALPPGLLGTLMLGFLFGLSASPCATPVLTLLLGFTAKTRQPLIGGIALFSYALGQSVLLLLAGWGAAVLKHRARLLNVGHQINFLSGIILIGCGLVWMFQGLTEQGWLAR